MRAPPCGCGSGGDGRCRADAPVAPKDEREPSAASAAAARARASAEDPDVTLISTSSGGAAELRRLRADAAAARPPRAREEGVRLGETPRSGAALRGLSASAMKRATRPSSGGSSSRRLGRPLDGRLEVAAHRRASRDRGGGRRGGRAAEAPSTAAAPPSGGAMRASTVASFSRWKRTYTTSGRATTARGARRR